MGLVRFFVLVHQALKKDQDAKDLWKLERKIEYLFRERSSRPTPLPSKVHTEPSCQFASDVPAICASNVLAFCASNVLALCASNIPHLRK